MTIKNGRKKDGTFAKGYGGGPGRPKKELAIPELLRQIGEQEITSSTGEKASKLKALMHIVYKMALGGDRWAIDFIANRTEGKPIETVRTQEIERDELIEI